MLKVMLLQGRGSEELEQQHLTGSLHQLFSAARYQRSAQASLWLLLLVKLLDRSPGRFHFLGRTYIVCTEAIQEVGPVAM
jgi:hypothetical protein